MGRVHTNTVKKAAQVTMETYCMHLGNNFHTNKHQCEEIAIIPSKKPQNKIAGYVTHLMKQIQRGSVSALYQVAGRRERRERIMFLRSQDQEIIEVDPDTKEMLKRLDCGSLSNLQVTQPAVGMSFKTPRGAV